jgi:hypothetical protein
MHLSISLNTVKYVNLGYHVMKNYVLKQKNLEKSEFTVLLFYTENLSGFKVDRIHDSGPANYATATYHKTG